MHDVEGDRDREARADVRSAKRREDVGLFVVVAAVLHLRGHADARALRRAASATRAAEAAAAPTAARAAASAAPRLLLREVVRDPQVHVVVADAVVVT